MPLLALFTANFIFGAALSSFDDFVKASPETMCMYPFSHVNFKFEDKVSCCFRSKPMLGFAKLPGESKEIWNSAEFRNLRQDLIAGKKPSACENCWKLEEGGGFSYRQESIRDHVIHSRWRGALDTYDVQTGNVAAGPAQVEVRLSNLCGLTCRMCSPEYSSKWKSLLTQSPALKRWHKEKSTLHDDAREAVILQFLQDHKRSLRYIMFSGGEPLLQKGHYDALKTLAPFEGQMSLEYTSNLNTLRDGENSVLDYWPSFRRVRVKISLDADPEIYPFVRVGGSIEKVAGNIKTLQARFPSTNRLEPINHFPDDHLILIGTCTVSVYNIERLPEIAKYFTSQGLIFHTSQVQLPSFQSTQVLPQPLKEKVRAKLQSFLDQIETELKGSWGEQRLWQNEDARETQMYRIKKFVGNSILFMNAREAGNEFAKLDAFEQDFASATRGAKLLDIYPEWQPYV